jgi:diguanylate cyclase (GGDEF)-like protein/PAS domain S-box-containing protein
MLKFIDKKRYCQFAGRTYMENNILVYHEVLNNLYEGVYVVDVNRQITFWNRSAENISGFSSDEIVGRSCYSNILNHVDEEGNSLCFGGCPLHKTIMDGQDREAVVYLHHKNGHRVPVAVRTVPLYVDGKTVGAIEIFSNSASQIDVLNRIEELQNMALRDHLTNLPNRRYLEAFLTSRAKEARDLKIPFSVAMFDIDFFKNVNDVHGHDIGDLVLKMVADTLSGVFRKSDCLGRWGGEEFVAVLPGIGKEDLMSLLEKAKMLVQKSVLRMDDQEISVTVSIGVTMAGENEIVTEIVKRADEGLYASKHAGRNCITWVDLNK